jgi:hypothetical protein
MTPIRPIDREQVEIEARAKTFWGDSREEVVKFLMMQGISAPEAMTLAEEFFQERAQTIRGMGLKKIFIGVPLMAVPLVAWISFMSMRFIPMKIFALTIMVGLYGTWLLLKGLIMFFSPKSEPGDVADK